MLTVPEPLPNDPESVVTALETAEIFGKQGDLKEAVRWVRRAAEIAGDEGSDERALTLARAVADLNISASQPPKPPPAQPQAARGAPSDDLDGDAETRVVDSSKLLSDFEREEQAKGNGAAEEGYVEATLLPETAAADDLPPPPPPPAEAAPPPPPLPGSALATPIAAPAPPPRRDDDVAPISKRNIGSIAELLAQKEAELPSSVRPAAEVVQTPDQGWGEDPPPPPPTTTPPVERRTAHPVADRTPTPLIPSQPHTERPAVNAPLLQAVRASVVATAEPGVFVLRVLAADQQPAPTAHEVVVVATNPLASPFK